MPLYIFPTAPYPTFIPCIFNGKILGRYLGPKFCTFSSSSLMLYPTTQYITTSCVPTVLSRCLHDRLGMQEASSPLHMNYSHCLKAYINISSPFQGPHYQSSILIWGASKIAKDVVHNENANPSKTFMYLCL